MTNVNEFDTAKAVVDLLKGVDTERQVRILRWVSESLGILIHTSTQSGGVSPTNLGGGPQHAAIPGAVTDIKSFVSSKDPKSDNQFAATVAYFYRFAAPQNERRDSITAEVLQEATRLSGRARLGDPGKTLRNAKDMGYLDVSDRGEYKINTVGENLVAMTLPGQGRASPARTPKKKQSHRKKSKR